MSILERIEQQRIGYLVETGRDAKYLFVGEKEGKELDKKQGMFVITYKNMFVVMVEKDNWLSVGDKYQEG